MNNLKGMWEFKYPNTQIDNNKFSGNRLIKF